MSFRDVIERGREFILAEKSSRLPFLSRITIATMGLFCKALVNGLFKADVRNLDILLEAYKTSQLQGRGLLTVMNHTSVVDDPLVWGNLPLNHLLDPKSVRFGLGADDICYKNKFLGTFFSLGKVLSTKRFGMGPFQGSIDAAVSVLSPPDHNLSYSVSNTFSPMINSAGWVHIFPEGRVHQVYPPHDSTLRYFHWGVSRLILESSQPPIIVPMFINGLEKVMPEDLPEGTLKVPRNLGSKLLFSVGAPLQEKPIVEYRQKWLDLVNQDPDADLKGDLTENLRNGDEVRRLRSSVALHLRGCVDSLRTDMGFPAEKLDLGDYKFWAPAQSSRGVKVMGHVGNSIKSVEGP